MLKGYRTYIADVLLIVTLLQGVIPQVTFLPSNVTVVVGSILGALVLVFRYLATSQI
jgi:hypothetical protein